HVCNLAMRDGECWDLIVQLFEGKAKQLKGKNKTIATPKSYNPFVNAGPLPDSVLAVFLKQLLNGDLDVPGFKAQCERMKC
ncbi:MAG: hypothetical protein GY751_19015, partial [Bacteroidetes bacterium]|nr:hypothetical protein [Bacteroidota bacterium]